MVYFSANSSTLNDIKTSLNKDKVLNLPNALLQFSLNQNNDPDQYFDSVKYNIQD